MLRSVSFNQKMWSGIAVIVLLLLLSGSASLYNLLSINHSNNRVGDTAVPALFVANDAQIRLLKLINISTRASAAEGEDELRELTRQFSRHAAGFESVLADLQRITGNDTELEPLSARIVADYAAYRSDAALMLESKLNAIVAGKHDAEAAANRLQDAIDRLGQVYADIQNYRPDDVTFRSDALDAAHAAAGVDMYLQNIGRLLDSVRKATRLADLDNLQADVAGELTNTTGQFEASVVMQLEAIGQQHFVTAERRYADALKQEIMRDDNFVEMKRRHLRMVERSAALSDKANEAVMKAVTTLDTLLTQSKQVFNHLQSELDGDVGFGVASTSGFTSVLLFLPLLVFISMMRAIKRKISDLGNINNIGRKLADAKSVDMALQQALDGLSAMFPSIEGSLFLATRDNVSEGRFATVCHRGDDVCACTTAIDHNLILEVYDRKTSLLRSTPTSSPISDDVGKLQMVVPLIDEGDCVGAIYLAAPAKSSAFTENDVDLVSTIANSLTVAIKKITMMEKTEEQNRQLRRMDELKDEFLANTSHELRTPLNGIIGLAEASLYDNPASLSSTLRDNLGMIVTSGKRLGSLVNDILDFAKLRHEEIALHPKHVDANAMVDVVLTLSSPLVKGKPIQLVNDVPAGLPAAWCDENRLQQILHNLVGNAIKFTREGRVTVSAGVEPGFLHITVTDTGIGIPTDRLDSIFESFNQGDGSIQREFGGTGLGLSITRRLVELHGGQINVTSTVGSGSAFCFSLPLANATHTEQVQTGTELLRQMVSVDDDIRRAPPSPDKTAPASLQTDDGTAQPATTQTRAPSHWVLVVDDEPINRQVLKAQLGSAGFGVVEAGDGQEALDILANPERTFDLVLLDVMMPRLSGFATCAALRKQHPAILLPVIFLTAKSQTEDVLTGFAAGGNDYLVKPFSRDELLARIRIHLELITTHRIIKNYSRGLEDKVAARTRELVEMQQELVMRQKQAALGVMTAGVAHEINNPNNFVQVALQNTLAWKERFEAFVTDLLAEDGDPEIRDMFVEQLQKLQEQLGLIEQGSKRIDRIVQGLRVITRLDEAEHQQADVLDGLEKTIELLLPSVSQTVRFDIQLTARPTLYCWPAEMNQVFMNVLMNAVRAIEDKGSSHPGRITVSSCEADDMLEIVITDDGVGMQPDVLQRACDPFFTTRGIGSGAGLGLSISREILSRHNGELLIASDPGAGTRVTLRLPVIAEFVESGNPVSARAMA